MPTDITGIILSQSPLVILLGYILFAGARKTWVWGYQLSEAQDRCNRLESIVFQQLNVNKTFVEKVQTKVEP
jgi:hypothetical protein